MKTMEQKQYKHIELNNQVTKRNETGFFDLEKDQEALSVYLEEIDDKTVKFDNELDRVRFLVYQNFYYKVFEYY
ncbi:ribonucleotide-diphosphate reductase subunit alpha, partial [Staphylococcus chromogenes]